jgi:uroporphyrinogen decarboxylase
VTPRERWLALLEGRVPDRTPCDYWGTAEVTGRLMKDLGCAGERELWRKLGVDRLVRVAPVHPRAIEKTWYIQSQYSVWGIGTREVAYGDGTYIESVSHPLAGAESAADVEQYAWPEASEWSTEGLLAECGAWRDYPILLGSYEPFLLYCRMRGMEQAFRDLVEDEPIVEAALERIHGIHTSLIRRCLEESGALIDFLWVSEDLGTQGSLLVSPALFRRFLKPRLQSMMELAHSYGVRVFHHDDGAIRRLIPELLEMGIDVLNPIQWRCAGMAREELARDFGDKVVFHGGVDNQHTLPFGTPEDVRREVAENMRLLGGGKGYIVAPCHNIQPNTPTQNILALYETVHDLAGGY